VWRTDRSYVSAAFGLARALLARGERLEAYDVLCSVPETSNHHVAARLAAAEIRVRNVPAQQLTEEDLTSAGSLLAALELEPGRRAKAEEQVLGSAFGWVTGGAGDRPGAVVLGCPLREYDLRVALESCYRTLARHADNTRERIVLVDSANQIRPTTWA
jgi:serine/threonine-protein kinase PknG